MDLLFQRHQFNIRQLHKTERISDIKDLFNEVVLFLNNTTHNQTDGLHVLSVICYELTGIHTLKFLNHPEIMNHQFFKILSNTFSMLLTKVTFILLTKHDEQCFDGISLLVSNLCLNNNKISSNFYIDNNEKFDPNNKEKFNLISYEKIFFTKLFIKKFVRILEDDIAVNDYELYHIKYKVIDRLLRVFMKLSDIDHTLILDPVITCVQSKIYIEIYKTIDLRLPLLSPKQILFIYQCPKFIRLCSYKQQEEISQKLSRSMIQFSSDIFQKQLPIISRGDAKIQAVAWYVELLNHFALTPKTRVFFIESKFKYSLTID